MKCMHTDGAVFIEEKNLPQQSGSTFSPKTGSEFCLDSFSMPLRSDLRPDKIPSDDRRVCLCPNKFPTVDGFSECISDDDSSSSSLIEPKLNDFLNMLRSDVCLKRPRLVNKLRSDDFLFKPRSGFFLIKPRSDDCLNEPSSGFAASDFSRMNFRAESRNQTRLLASCDSEKFSSIGTVFRRHEGGAAGLSERSWLEFPSKSFFDDDPIDFLKRARFLRLPPRCRPPNLGLSFSATSSSFFALS